MLILIEGADGLGKTTLAKALQWHRRCAYVHHSPPAHWTRADFLTVLPNAVYDRFHWSMWAYKQVNRQPLDLSMDDCIAIDERLAIMLDGEYHTVCLYASDDSYFDRMPADHMFDCNLVKQVNAEYQRALQHFGAAIDVSAQGYPTVEQINDLLGL